MDWWEHINRKHGEFVIHTLILAIFTSFQILAIDESNISFYQGEDEVVFIENKNLNYIYSKNCLKNNCLALKSIQNLPRKINVTSGGANPGAIFCTDNLSGTLIKFKDKMNNEITFCKFNDDSMISVGSILQKVLDQK